MEFRSDESGARSSGMLTEPASTTALELDLYDELSSFSALSPEEQRKELERIAPAVARPASAAENRARESFDFIEPSDLPELAEPILDQSTRPSFDLIDESPLEPVDLPDPPPAQPIFAFVEEPARESIHARDDGHFTSESTPTLEGTSPLVDMFSGVSLSLETELRCESCGAASNTEDLFCLACGQLLAEMDW